MWYQKKEPKGLDYSKPIIARSGSYEYILMPQIERGSYKVIGYNWFRLTEVGCYNSCTMFKTAEDAVACYASNHTITNGIITIKTK